MKTGLAAALFSAVLAFAFSRNAFHIGGTAAVVASGVVFFLFFAVVFHYLFPVMKKRGVTAASAVLPALLALGAVSAVLASDFFSDVSPRLNKRLAAFPDVNPFHESFPKKTDDYINDRIGFKTEGADLSGRLLPRGAAGMITKASKVVSGRDGWLFYNEDGTYETVLDYLRARRIEKGLASAVASNLMEIDRWAGDRGIKFYVLFPPPKHDVYPEYYVPHWNRLPGESLYDLVAKELSGSESPLVDLRRALAEAKKEGEIYYKNDTHWNYRGGYAAYRELMKRIEKDFPGLSGVSEDDIEYKSVAAPEPGDLANMLPGIAAKYPPSVQPLPKRPASVSTEKDYSPSGESDGFNNLRRVTDNEKGLKIFVVHDSFFDAMIPFLLLNSRIMEDRREWGTSPLKYAREIEEFAPDVLILEGQQRYLNYFGDELFNNKWKK